MLTWLTLATFNFVGGDYLVEFCLQSSSNFCYTCIEPFLFALLHGPQPFLESSDNLPGPKTTLRALCFLIWIQLLLIFKVFNMIMFGGKPLCMVNIRETDPGSGCILRDKW